MSAKTWDKIAKVCFCLMIGVSWLPALAGLISNVDLMLASLIAIVYLGAASLIATHQAWLADMKHTYEVIARAKGWES